MRGKELAGERCTPHTNDMETGLKHEARSSPL